MALRARLVPGMIALRGPPRRRQFLDDRQYFNTGDKNTMHETYIFNLNESSIHISC